MAVDFLYEKAPLIEVIAEVHWALKKLDTAPDARIDPYFDLFRETFIEKMKLLSFEHIQELVPPMIPIELLAEQPVLRFRTEANSWPLVQIGPGVMTANIVPPYEGWAAFKPFLQSVTNELFACYPIPNRTLHITRLHLRYVDAFSASFGLVNFSKFVQEKLGVCNPLPKTFLNKFAAPIAEELFTFESTFKNTSPAESMARIKIAPGTKGHERAVIMELHCDQTFPTKQVSSVDHILSWFDLAHAQLRKQFENIATDDLKKVMGEKKDIK